MKRKFYLIRNVSLNLFQSVFDVRYNKAISGHKKQMITITEFPFPLLKPVPLLTVLAKSDNIV